MQSDNEEDSSFYFESDHLALRGNKDYSSVLRTIAILEAQRTRVHQQLEELVLARKRYTEQPELLLKKLRNNEEIIAPDLITIAKVPELSKNYDDLPIEATKIKEEPGLDTKLPIVRGRIVDESKSETFNQLWTFEEQRRLEQLLIEYPFEEVENRRFTKIAKALGNRTPQQVASRVQKYFQKLHDAGMPIPGRRPKNRRIGQPKTKHLYRPSTFFPAHNVPVQMPEDDYIIGDLHTGRSRVHSPVPHGASAGGADCFGVQRPEVKQRVLQILQVIRNEKLEAPGGYNPDPLAAKCEDCQMASVTSTHWRCNTCYCPVNLCADCFVTQLLERTFDHLTHDVVADQDT